MNAPTDKDPRVGTVALHRVRPEHVGADSVMAANGCVVAWASLGPIDIYADSLDELAAIGEQIKLMAMRAKARRLLDTNPFRGDAA